MKCDKKYKELTSLENENNFLKGKIMGLGITINNYIAKIAEKDLDLAEKNLDLARKDEELARKDEELANLRAQIAHLSTFLPPRAPGGAEF